MFFLVACWITGLSFSRSVGMAMTLLTLPEASAWALTEQIICSRQPLPARVLLTPMTYFWSDPPPLPPQAARVLVVGRVEQARGLLVAHHRPAGQHRWHATAGHQQPRGPDLELVHHRHPGDARAGPGRARPRPGCRGR